MLIQFCLGWKRFKFPAAADLFNEYTGRISKFGPCESFGNFKVTKKSSGVQRWLCDRQGKAVSSELLAGHIQTLMDQGIRQLEIVIGGPDGFSDSEIQALQSDFKWSFGPLTLPHELAAVVAGEQIYRAWTIIRKMPYHIGH